MDCFRFRHHDGEGRIWETDLIECPEEEWDASGESADDSWCVIRCEGMIRALKLTGDLDEHVGCCDPPVPRFEIGIN